MHESNSDSNQTINDFFKTIGIMRENKGIEKSFHRGNWDSLFNSIEDTRVLCYFICYFITMVFPGKVLIKDYSKEGSIFFKDKRSTFKLYLQML